LTARRH